MAFFLLDAQGRPVGPYSREELQLFLERGLIDAHAPVVHDGPGPAREVAAMLAEPPAAGPAPRGTSPRADGARPPLERGAGGDFLRLAPHLMLPIEDILRLRWFDNRRILALAVIGLLPLFVLIYLQTTGDLSGSIWGVALYSSLLWALFFYVAFSQPEVTLFQCVSAFVGSAVFSVGLVALAHYILPFRWVLAGIASPNIVTRWSAHLLGVAAVEELAKLFMLYFLWARRLHPRTMMFYGLMAGLGFGIYEGVAYQSSQNLRISFPDGRSTPDGAAVYYMLNILRLTSLPFLHAMWTGIAGYFIGFAGQYPQRRGGLLLAALVVPAVLHGTYNTFSNSLVGLTVAVVTVLALNLYLVKGRDFEAILAGHRTPA